MLRLFDVRAGEARGKLIGFAVLLLLIIGAHTVLETARDALLLAGPGPKALGLVYIAIAAGTLPGAALVARAGTRFGQKKALAGTLAVGVAGPLLLFLGPASHAAAMATYVLSGILGSTIVPQFWTLVGTALTVGQGRRLFGLISAAGVVGGVLGPAAASGALLYLPVKGLLLVSSAVFATSIGALAFVKASERAPAPEAARKAHLVGMGRAFRENPFLSRIALVVFLSTSTFLALDYLFKSTLARSLTGQELGRFIAHYYLLLNGASLLVQLFSGTVIRRLGVLPALVPTPLLLLAGAVVALLGGGALPGVLLVKGIDGSLRYSLHRVSGELMYLPVPSLARQRTKPFIDGGLARLAQTVTGATLLALGGTALTEPRPLAAIVATLAAIWLATVVTMRRPYLRLLRGAVSSGSLIASDTAEPLDLETAQMLVQCLSSEDPYEVEGAMKTLARRGRPGFVPALVLLHRDAGVLEQALEMFGASSRSDWFSLARRLLEDPRESVRVAAARALARQEQIDPTSLATDVGWRARGYGAVRMALRDPSTDVLTHPNVETLLEQDGGAGAGARLGMLAAVADAPASARLWPLLRQLAVEPRGSRERTELFAQAAASQADPMLVPYLVSLLSVRDGREAVRAALVTFGDPALEGVLRTLADPTRPRRLRLHMPKTIARFASRRSAEYLLAEIETERDGQLRYKTIRALRVLVTEHRIAVDRRRAERCCATDLNHHFRRLALRSIFGPPTAGATAAANLLPELLEEKAAHALDRAFQLLQIAHPRQGVHHAFVACRGKDAYARASAAELLDTLLRRTDQQRLRDLFRLATDELSIEDRVERARGLVADMPGTREDAVAALTKGRDPVLVALARRLDAPRPTRPLGDVLVLPKAR